MLLSLFQHTTHHYGCKAANLPGLDLGHQLVRKGPVDVPPGPHFDGNGTREILGHALQGALELLIAHHEGAPGPLVAQQIQWTASSRTKK